jgi:gliding motility-associated-like protein
LRYILVNSLLFIFCLNNIIVAQTKINGVINHYAQVTAISNLPVGGAVLHVDNALAFNEYDTVLLIQMTGVSSDGNNVNNAGKYEFHIVSSVNKTGKIINLRAHATFDPVSEAVQLVRVPSYKNAHIVDTLTCAPWNGHTGGVLVLMAGQTLTLGAHIDISAKGFRGGGISTTKAPGEVDCDIQYNNDNYADSEVNAAGYKGEGSVTRTFQTGTPRGRGNAWNGGGGGNGAYSGGGGGGGGGNGGQGGYDICYYPGFSHASGGRKFRTDYSEWNHLIFMGGGGGSGTGYTTNTPGGIGGGIAIIVAEKLVFTDHAKIMANGKDVSGAPSDGGAGGGGAGGSVLIMADYEGEADIELKGGNGGNTTNYSCVFLPTSGSFGTGGGGGGGVLYISQDEADFRSKHKINLNFGTNGETSLRCGNSQTMPGVVGTIRGNTKLQLKGFLYNIITSPDMVLCAYESATITASTPHGGDTYQYLWEWRRGEKGSWTPAFGINNEQHYTTTFILSDTVFFRRTVSTNQLIDGVPTYISEISAPMKMVILQPISHNRLTGKDTILCENVPDLTIEGLSASGAAENFTYQWEKSIAGAEWSKVSGTEANLVASLEAGIGKYRRIAVSQHASAHCLDTSNYVQITVLPVISNNTIASDQQLCESGTAATLDGTYPLGGDEQYRYGWQNSQNGREWNDLNVATNSYLPEQKYIGDRYYRRIVISGKWDCCTDTSHAVTIRFDRFPAKAYAGAKQTLHFKFQTVLDATPISVGEGIWTAVKGDLHFSDPESPSTQVTGLEMGSNTMEWTVTNGVCPSVSDRVSVEVQDIVIPSGFSPNNDRLNDCFGVLGIENSEKFELVIINRSNQVVYYTSSIKSGYSYSCLWDGKNWSGKELPAGVYFYQLTIDGNKIYKGYVTLKK